MKRLSLFLCLVAALFLLAACGGGTTKSKHVYEGRLVKQYGGVKTRPDPVARRSVFLVQPKTGERIETVYFHDGAYDEAAMQRIDHLFRDQQTGEILKIDPELIDFLVDIRTRLGLPAAVPFEILSGYRSPESNERLRLTNGQVAKESLHTKGLAVDFRIAAVSGAAIAEIAKTMQRGGVSFYPSDNHVHVDIGNIRTWSTR
jgi:uncharacterized protein YcbK (DUF882 family)